MSITAKAKNESGGIFTALLMAVALTATVGVAAFQVLSGPLSTMVRVKNQTLAETDMFAAAKIVMLDAINLAGNGDCDADTFIEPVAWLSPGGPTGGGLLPLTIGANVTDPWGSQLGYCVWDIGPLADDAGCGGPGASRLDGTDNPVAGNEDTQTVIAIISSGPDRIFQSSCADYVDATTSVVTAGGDDLIKKYTYLNAAEVAGGLWTLKSGDPGTATIAKDLEVGADISFDSSAGLINTLAVNSTGKVIAGGGAQVGDETDVTTCDINNVGLLRYNVAGATVEVCDGADWVASGGGGGSVADVTSGLVGRWKFDETSGTNANDETANNNDGTLTDGPTWTASGHNDGAVVLDGTNDYVVVADSASLDVTNITLSAWVYKTVADHADWSSFIGRQFGASWDEVFALGYNDSASDEYVCSIRTAGGGIGFSGPASTDDLNTWVHIACTYNGTIIRLYRNGIEVASAAQSGNMVSETKPVVMGAGNNVAGFTPDEFFGGRLDDVRMYDRALSDSEILQVYEATGGLVSGNNSGWTDDGTVVRLTTSTDNVGIGTATPAGALHVKGTGDSGANPTLTVDNDAATHESFIAFNSNGTQKWLLGMEDSDDGNTGAYDFAIFDWDALDWRFVISKSTGYVGIGTVTPETLLHISSETDYSTLTLGHPNVTGNANTDGQIVFYGEYNGNVYSSALTMESMNMFFGTDGPGGMIFNSDVVISSNTPPDTAVLQIFDPDTIEYLTIEHNGSDVIFNTSAGNFAFWNSGTSDYGVIDAGDVNILGTAREASLSIGVADDNWFINPSISPYRSRGTLANPTVVASGDSVLSVWPTAYDGNSWETPALIQFFVDGTPGDGDMPGRIEFQTQADGAAVNPESTTPEMVIKNNGAVGIGTASPASVFVVAPPATETIGAGATITADACGTIKRITAAGPVTTNTTDTFTAPTASYAGCCMDVINVGGQTITLDFNGNFKSNGGVDQALTTFDGVRVCSDGSVWYQISPVSNN